MDKRIRFSKFRTFGNFLLSSLQTVGLGLLRYGHKIHKHPNSIIEVEKVEVIDDVLYEIFHIHIKGLSYKGILIVIVSLHCVTALFTTIFILYDSLFCWCCSCCLGAGGSAVFDPDHPEANLVWRNGKVIDLDKDDNNKLEAECAENKTFFNLFYGISLRSKIHKGLIKENDDY